MLTKVEMRILIPLLIALFPGSSYGQKSNGFHNYVRLKMANFPSWIQENKLDPSKPLGPRTAPCANYVNGIHSILTNIVLKGHSGRGIVLKNDSISGGLAHGDNLLGILHLSFEYTSSYRYTGDYIAVGVLNSTTTYCGRGKWTFLMPPGSSSDVIMYFRISQTGYIKPTNFIYLASNVPGGIDWHPARFKGSWENVKGKDHADVKQLLIHAIRDYVQNALYPRTTRPIDLQLQQFLEEIFEEETFEEISRTPA